MYLTIIAVLILLIIVMFYCTKRIIIYLLNSVFQQCTRCETLFDMDSPMGEGRVHCPKCGSSSITSVKPILFYSKKSRRLDKWVQIRNGILYNKAKNQEYDYVTSHFL